MTLASPFIVRAPVAAPPLSMTQSAALGTIMHPRGGATQIGAVARSGPGVSGVCGMRTGAASGAGAERFVHDSLDGAGAAPALRAAPEAAVDLPSRPRADVSPMDRRAYVAV